MLFLVIALFRSNRKVTNTRVMEVLRNGVVGGSV